MFEFFFFWIEVSSATSLFFEGNISSFQRELLNLISWELISAILYN